MPRRLIRCAPFLAHDFIWPMAPLRVRLASDSERAPAWWPPPSAGGWDEGLTALARVFQVTRVCDGCFVLPGRYRPPDPSGRDFTPAPLRSQVLPSLTIGLAPELGWRGYATLDFGGSRRAQGRPQGS